MEHPGLDIVQIKKDLTIEEIQVKISDINKRMSFAFSTNNQSLINQLGMVLEVYQRAQNEMLDDMFGDSGIDPDGKIDIS